ncbi:MULTISPECIES: ABC transporter permease [Mesorhizobium]|uniref:ABC transporter permease n=2 Tax=Mesorhizobium TaxID=68287 RepID=UPI0004CE0300|nr:MULTISPECIES: ABC transporter permease [Mesorhizobium]WJI41973.1 ABC transporter permease [Mesorhizobium opportunistum]
MAKLSYATPVERAWHIGLRVICGAVLLFLIAPIIVIVPLSFNSESFFTYPLPGVSLKWYVEFFTNPRWIGSVVTSFVVAATVTAISTALGVLASMGLAQLDMRGKSVIIAMLLLPMIVPVIISSVGMYFFYVSIGILNIRWAPVGLILAHTALAAPFVVISVTATLSGFDRSLIRAGASLGGTPTTVFFKVVMPLILPGIISGALLAFATSFDEVVVAVFLTAPDQRTLPKQMFNGIRENINPTITAAATLLIIVSILLLTALEWLRRRQERLHGTRTT